VAYNRNSNSFLLVFVSRVTLPRQADAKATVVNPSRGRVQVQPIFARRLVGNREIAPPSREKQKAPFRSAGGTRETAKSEDGTACGSYELPRARIQTDRDTVSGSYSMMRLVRRGALGAVESEQRFEVQLSLSDSPGGVADGPHLSCVYLEAGLVL
jgi:hypothetical protein